MAFSKIFPRKSNLDCGHLVVFRKPKKWEFLEVIVKSCFLLFLRIILTCSRITFTCVFFSKLFFASFFRNCFSHRLAGWIATNRCFLKPCILVILQSRHLLFHLFDIFQFCFELASFPKLFFEEIIGWSASIHCLT